MKRSHLLSSCLLSATLLAGFHSRSYAGEAENFAKCLEYTRAIVDKHHLICLVDVEGDKKKNKFRYDHYPETERLQVNGSTYARKKGGAWLKSDDWGDTGSKIKESLAEELDLLASFTDAPLQNRTVSKDKSQGGQVIEETKREPKESSEWIHYVVRRQKSTGFGYPQFVFNRYAKDPDDKAMLIGYAGFMYAGEEKVHVNINYSYMFLINATVTNANDIPKKADAAAPEDDKTYNFNELDQKKFELRDKVVKLQITPKVLQQEDVGGGNFRLMVKDTATPRSNYGLVDFPKDGMEKLGLADKSARENITLYVRVTPRTKEAVAQFTALGRSFDKDDKGAVSYKW